MEFKNYNILVTGGSDGIGKAIAESLAKRGANLWLVGRNLEKLETVKTELEVHSGEIIISSVDLGKMEEVIEFTKSVHQKWKQMNALINNVGIGIFKPFNELNIEEYDLMFQLNVRTPFILIKSFAGQLKYNMGSVINISSYLGERIMPHLPTSVYSATKGAINSMTKGLAMEMGPEVRINAIAPGTVATPMARSNIGKLPEDRQKILLAYVEQHYPMKKIGRPQDIANMVCFLVSEEAEWITGAVYQVDGGLTVT